MKWFHVFKLEALFQIWLRYGNFWNDMARLGWSIEWICSSEVRVEIHVTGTTWRLRLLSIIKWKSVRYTVTLSLTFEPALSYTQIGFCKSPAGHMHLKELTDMLAFIHTEWQKATAVITTQTCRQRDVTSNTNRTNTDGRFESTAYGVRGVKTVTFVALFCELAPDVFVVTPF